MVTIALNGALRPYGVAVIKGSEVLAEYAWTPQTKKTELFVDYIQKLLKDSGHTPKDVEAIYVVEGPGNYTGLRLSISTANTWNQVTGTPIYKVSSFKLQLAEMGNHDGLLFSVMPAIKGHLNVQLFSVKNGQLMAASHPYSPTYNEFLAKLAQFDSPVSVVGSVSDEWKDAVNRANCRGIYTNSKASNMVRFHSFLSPEQVASYPLSPTYSHAAVSKPKEVVH